LGQRFPERSLKASHTGNFIKREKRRREEKRREEKRRDVTNIHAVFPLSEC
jgi:hypothetical protein